MVKRGCGYLKKIQLGGAVMTKREKLLIFLGVLAFFLFNYPYLHIFNRTLFLGGVPLLVVYLFGVWVLTIAVLLVSKNRLSSRD